MKLIDCTQFRIKPPGGIPGTTPGVWEDRAWRTFPDSDLLAWSRKLLVAWALSVPAHAPVMFDAEPIFIEHERRNHGNPETAFRQVADMLGIVRAARPELEVWVYVGGRFWAYVDPAMYTQHLNVRDRKVYVSRLCQEGLCAGLAAEAYPIRCTKAGKTARDKVYDEDQSLEYMGTFFKNLGPHLANITGHTPILPVLGTHFLGESAHYPLPASTFRAVRDLCAQHFDRAMVWGGIEYGPKQKYKRHRDYAEQAELFEDIKPSGTVAAA